MKLFLILNLTVFLQVSASVYSQKTLLDYNAKNMTVKDVLKDIESKTGFRFFYNDDYSLLNSKVNLNVTNSKVEDVLETILADTDLSFKVLDDKLIVLMPKVEAQQLSISGKVIDADGYPLPGVNIVEKGTTTGTVTNLDGEYTISVTAPNTTLIFSFVGYLSEEVILNGETTVNVTLVEDIMALDEVVVIGYGVQKKSNVTGAISSVKKEDIQNRTITRAEQALQGKSAGVQLISTSAQPGSSPSIRIRGFSSNGVSDPLYVVDGLIVEDISSIDPNNIASMEVLKDAASAAIYGAQAGNGVVLITTKTGDKGTSSISYDVQYSLSNLARRPSLLNSEEAIQQNLETGNWTQADVDALITNGIWDGEFSTDWYDVAFESSPMVRHTLSMQGANDKGKYFLSLNHLNEDGIVVGDEDYYKRISGMINAEYNIKPWLKVGTTTNLDRTKSSSISDGSSNSIYSSMISGVMSLAPYWASTYSADALPTTMQSQIASGWNLFTDENGDYYMTLGSSEAMHPMVAVLATDDETSSTNLLGTLYANFTPVKGLTYTSRLGYRLGNSNYYSFTNDYYGSGSRSSTQNSATRSNTTTSYYQWENFANYSLSLNNHNITALAGMSYSERSYKYVYASVDQVMTDDDLYADVSYGAGDATNTVEGYELGNTKISYFGRLSYDFAGKYFIQGNLRADAADEEILPLENSWGYFPSVSTGWLISEENFFKNLGVDQVSYIKLRASWGQNGSTSNLSDWTYSNVLDASATGYSFSTGNSYQISVSPSQIPNYNLKWETSEQLDFGLDIRAFNDRLTYSMDWFKKETKDLIVSDITINLEVGNESAPINAGNVRNTGFEFELGWKDKIGELSYSASANLATLNNEVTYLSPLVSNGRIMGSSTQAAGGSFSVFEVGYPVWYFYGYKVDYIGSDGEPVYVDVDESGEIDANDKTNIGKPIPDFTYGVTLSLAWKGFDFLAFGSGSYGNDIFMALGYNTISYQLKEIYDERWTSDGSISGKYAKPGIAGDYYRISDAYVYDGSYFKIKQVQLGYTLPENIAKKFFVSKLRVYTSLDDWFVFTKYPGLDPEVSAAASYGGMGVDYGNYPNTRKTVFGLSVTF